MSRVTRADFDAALGPGKQSGQEWIYLCPFCADGSKKLSINFRKRAGICFKCHTSGNLEHLADRLAIDRPGADSALREIMFSVDAAPPADDEGSATPVAPKRMPSRYTGSLRLIRDGVTAIQDPQVALARRFLVEERGLSLDTIRRARLMVSSDYHWQGYVIFPVYEDIRRKELIYFSGRSYVTGLPKQKNPFSAEQPRDRGQVIYGSERMQMLGWGTVCEAPLDALKVSPFAGATYGTQVTAEQLMALREMGLRKLVWYFDGEVPAQKKAWECAWSLSGSFPQYVACPPQDMDPGALTEEQNTVIVSKHAVPVNAETYAQATVALGAGQLPFATNIQTVVDTQAP